jgi:ABC-type bacteriocin/lantibiotic exporter with double-glycine peptidase domain
MFFHKNLYRKFNLSISVLPSIEKKKCLIIFFLILLGVVLEIISFSSIVPVSTILLSDQNDFINNFKKIYSINNKDLIIIALLCFLFLLILKNLYLFLLAKYQIKFVNRVLKNLRLNIFDNYLEQSVVFLSKKNSSAFLQNIINYCNIYTTFFLLPLLNLTLEILVLFFTICILLYFNFMVTLFCSLLLFIFGGIILFLNKNSMIKYGSISNSQSVLFIKNIQQTFSAIKDIKILGKENFFRKRVEVNINLLNTSSYKAGIVGAYPKYLLETIIVSILILFLIYNLDPEYNQGIISPFLLLFVAAIFRLLPSINKILNLVNRIRFSLPTVKSLLNELKKIEENRYNAKINKKKNPKINIIKKIEINNLSFTYDNKKDYCLDALDLNIYNNSLIGITGKSGSGKSTLIDIIMGLKIPSAGFVKINNYDLLDINSNWRRMIGYVQQDVFLLDDTIKSNIAFGVQENNINKKKIFDLIKKTQLENFIKSLPEGIDTRVGERGARISGGQKQRIAIARALYSSPKILILDEATNGIDYDSEILILKLLKKIKKDIIIIFISHKKNVLKFCDVVYQLKNKKVYKLK